MSDLIQMPVKGCGKCEASYDIHEWAGLELTEEKNQVEKRLCAGRDGGRCGALLTLDTKGLDRLDLYIDADQYADWFPNSARPIDKRIRIVSTWRLFLLRLWTRISGFFARIVARVLA